MTLQVGALSCYKLQHSSGIAGLIGPFMTFLVWRFCVVAAIPDKGKWNKPCSPFQCWLKMGDDWVGATLRRGCIKISHFVPNILSGIVQATVQIWYFQWENTLFRKDVKSGG